MAKYNLKNDIGQTVRSLGVGSSAGPKVAKLGLAANRATLASAGKKGILFRDTAARLNNGFTGVGLTKLGAGLLGVGLIAGNMAKSAYDGYKNDKAMLRPQAEDIGYLSTMSMDAVGNVRGGRRDLGATGDLVFGLHAANQR